MPRKVLIYITAPPGDGLEKSRNWFREYLKPILVAGAVDYEVKEGSQPGQIETSVCEEIARHRREQAAKEQEQQSQLQNEDGAQTEDGRQNPFAPMMADVIKQKKSQQEFDGVLVVGRNAWREVLSGLTKGCEASLVEEKPVVVEQKQQEVAASETAMESGEEETIISEERDISANDVSISEPVMDGAPVVTETQEVVMIDSEESQKSEFSLPPSFSPIMYIPHHNIIGWTNIPHRLFMWIADYKRVDDVGRYAVAAVLNKTRPFELEDADMGESEKVYWIGEDAEEAVQNDVPIVVDERIRESLRTYTSEDLA
ncbi:mitochondrial import inner membrane translocase subunit tim54 [Apophysomyces sp. BC1015]|nr:mitochondrial import inner membrane translocase subunit tim54 [Apophysomyces sp. BC1015]